MKAIIFTVILSLLAAFYLATTMVIGEGGGGSILVIRSVPGLALAYGGGEEGSWRRAHPDAPEPWWLTGPYTRLAYFDDEATISPFVATYSLGYYATALSIIGLLIYYSLRPVFRKSHNT